MVERPDPIRRERDPIGSTDALLALAVGLLVAIVLLALLA